MFFFAWWERKRVRKLTSQEIISSLSLEEKAILLQGKTTWETYAVKHAGIIMSSYNMVNGRYANENAHLLDDILRKEWGFDGFVVTDWGGDNDHTKGVRAGSNLTMPAPGMDCATGLVESVRSGKLKEEVLGERLGELLRVVLDTNAAVKKAAAGTPDS